MLQAILSRTCCRAFNNRQLPDTKIESILKAAQAAPSAKNRQPWYFLVIKSKQVRKQIVAAATKSRKKQFAASKQEKSENMRQSIYQSSNDRIIAQAPVALLVMKDSDPTHEEAAFEELMLKEEQGVASAIYSILLAAWALKLGACWICSVLYIQNELKAIITQKGITWKTSWQARAIVPIGYPAGRLKKPERKDLALISKYIR